MFADFAYDYTFACSPSSGAPTKSKTIWALYDPYFEFIPKLCYNEKQNLTYPIGRVQDAFGLTRAQVAFRVHVYTRIVLAHVSSAYDVSHM